MSDSKNLKFETMEEYVKFLHSQTPGISEEDFMQELEKYPIVRSLSVDKPNDENLNNNNNENSEITSKDISIQWSEQKRKRFPNEEDPQFQEIFSLYISQFYQPESKQKLEEEFWKNHHLFINSLSVDQIEKLVKKLKDFKTKNNLK